MGVAQNPSVDETDSINKNAVFFAFFTFCVEL